MDLQRSCNIKLLSLLYLTLHCFIWRTSLTISVQQGQNVTLSCPLMPNSSEGVLSWYKQTAGQGLCIILSYNITNTSIVRYGMGLDQSRYAILTREGLNSRHFLQIITTLRNDTGTYYCGFSDKQQMHMLDKKNVDA
ncbi:secreted immunoglobulin domain 1 [Danio aesculapii]|uniref:secreted immunoglobulin domain 1 n=1 Tax=Danio aesculapii TaxID=1142201 RepID=UPI0024C05116|nr:secreted immunoglobulin domain 1 [Danio aesculapii]